MSANADFVRTILAQKEIDHADVAAIEAHLCQDDRLDLDDVKLLVELYCSGHEHCPAFEDLFFNVLEKVVLADGEVAPAEQFYLLKMLYSDRMIRPRERDFLLRLQRGMKRSTPEFEALCAEAFRAPPTDWDVGGR